MVAVLCEDLAPHGVVLTPGDSEAAGARVILHNRAPAAIASIAFTWTFSDARGRVRPHRFLPGTGTSVLLPFQLDARLRKTYAYRNTIFPGSKRLMTPDGAVSGDNTDVRPPREDEVWQGGSFGVGVSGTSNRAEFEPVMLALDGVFFVDGGFAGPNWLGSWEHTLAAAEAYLTSAALAVEARANGASPAEFFANLRQLSGLDDDSMPPPPPPSPLSQSPDPEPIRKHQRHWVAHQISHLRKTMGDAAAMSRIESWADAPVPDFHKL
jgi:hypothetical protein